MNSTKKKKPYHYTNGKAHNETNASDYGICSLINKLSKSQAGLYCINAVLLNSNIPYAKRIETLSPWQLETVVKDAFVVHGPLITLWTIPEPHGYNLFEQVVFRVKKKAN